MGEDAKYLATKANQRPSKAVIAIFDELFNLNGNAKFRNLMRYRFFGFTLPEDDIIEVFLDYDSRINLHLSDKDKVLCPLIKVQRKIFYEFEKYGRRVTSKKVAYDINWADADALEESMNEIISGLKQAKARYRGNNARSGGGGKGRKRKDGRKKKSNEKRGRIRRVSNSKEETENETEGEDEENKSSQETDEESTNASEEEESVEDEGDDDGNMGVSDEEFQDGSGDSIDDGMVEDEGVDDGNMGVIDEEFQDGSGDSIDDGMVIGSEDQAAGKDANGVTIEEQAIQGEDDGQQHNHNQSNRSMVCDFLRNSCVAIFCVLI